MVLEKIREDYLEDYNTLKEEAKENIELPENVLEALILTKEIFGSCSADELSEMSRQIDCWLKYFKKSGVKNHYDKRKFIAPYKELEKELYKMQKVLDAYESTKDIEEVEEY